MLLSALISFSPTWAASSMGMLAINLTLLIVHPKVVHGRWNWEGKLQATAGTLVMASLSGIPHKELGWTLPNRQGWGPPVIGVSVTASILSFLEGYAFSRPEDRFDAETWWFEATLPGIEEELFWRGLFPETLNRALGADTLAEFFGAPITPGDLVASLLFYGLHLIPEVLIHGWEQGMANTWDVIPATLILLYVRRRSGSVIPGILLHNAMNTFPALGAALRW